MGKPVDIDQIIHRVTNGHALEKHMHEFNDPSLGPVLDVKNADDLKKHLRSILNDRETIGVVYNPNGSYMGFYHQKTNTILYFEPKNMDGGSIYRAKDFGKEFLERISRHNSGSNVGLFVIEFGGYNALAEKFTAMTGEVPAHRFWGRMQDKLNQLGRVPPHIFRGMKNFVPESRLVSAFNVAAEIAPLVFKRGIKFLPGVGTAAVFFMAEAEAAELRDHAQGAVAAGALPPEALADYEKVLLAHKLQLNLDFSLAGQEAQVQMGFEKFAEAWGLNDHPEWKDRLEPPSLAEAITGMEMVPLTGEELQALWDALPAQTDGDMPPEVQALAEYKSAGSRERFAEYYYDLKQQDELHHVKSYMAENPVAENVPGSAPEQAMLESEPAYSAIGSGSFYAQGHRAGAGAMSF